MNSKTFRAKIGRKSANHRALAAAVICRPDLLLEVFEGLKADEARVKYGCLKLLRIISEKEPGVLYPLIGRFFQLLDSENTIVKWGAIVIVGNLAAVDSKGKIDCVLDRYLQPISGPVMITAANVIGGGARIASAKPHLSSKVARALLQVESAKYQTDECRNVALGHAVQALTRFFDLLEKPQPVVEFVKRQLANPRNAVRRKAAAFLKKHGRAIEARQGAEGVLR